MGPHDHRVYINKIMPDGHFYTRYPFPPCGYGFSFESRIKAWVKHRHTSALHKYMRTRGYFHRRYYNGSASGWEKRAVEIVERFWSYMLEDMFREPREKRGRQIDEERAADSRCHCTRMALANARASSRARARE